MTKMTKHFLVLGAVMALTHCQGQKSSIYDPTNGQNRLTTQQYLTAPVVRQQLLPSRPQSYKYSFSDENVDTCAQQAADLLNNKTPMSEMCVQLMYSTARINFGQYTGYPNEINYNFQQAGLNGGTPFSVPFNMGQFERGYPGYVNGYNQQYGNIVTPVNMQSFCGNPGVITNVQIGNQGSPCGSLNYSYAHYNVQNNLAYNTAYTTGNFSPFSTLYGPSGTLSSGCPGIYRSVSGYVGTLNRNVGAENAVLKANVQQSWSNVKALPQNVLSRLELTGMNVGSSIIDRLISGVEARGSSVVANNYAYTNYNQAMTNYNYQYANFANNYMLPMSASLTVAATVDPEAPEVAQCPQNLQYVINPQPTTNNAYVVPSCQQSQ